MSPLPRRQPQDVSRPAGNAVDVDALQAASSILQEVQERGLDGVRAAAVRLGDVDDTQPLVLRRPQLQDALAQLDDDKRQLLLRVAQRIRRFAEAQRDALQGFVVDIPGGQCGATVCAVERAGCYAPGGRYPLPSSVLMTAVTARAAGVAEVWVASPRPTVETLAAAAVAGADGVLVVGGAQAIGAFAYGAGEVPACDVIVGPGNKFVTAAKKLVAGDVRIDMLAGPSELLVVADAGADAKRVAADLLAQAEHDPDAVPVLVSTSEPFVGEVERELLVQLETLPTREVAVAALQNGGAVVVDDLAAAAEVSNSFAPEHLSLHINDAKRAMPLFKSYGAVFVGSGAAEVLADYGAGPNHVLPTGGTARSSGGLSAQTFLVSRSWLRIDDEGAGQHLVADAAELGRIEGLEAHARAAETRL